MSGWRSFTKTFRTKLDATEWVINFEKELRSKPIPENNIKSIKLKDLFNRYKVEILPKLGILNYYPFSYMYFFD